MVYIELSELLGALRTRGKFISWFLGSGVSIAAGIPSAYDLIEDFKLTLYRESEGVSQRLTSDLSNPVMFRLIEQSLKMQGFLPPQDADAYSYYFEKTHPSPADRRKKIEEIIKNKRPTYGHKALAALFMLEKARLIWTTNFDRLIEDACAELYGNTTTLTVSELTESSRTEQAIQEERWPLLVKLHGDYQSDKLRNTSIELKEQDQLHRDAYIESCKRFGLVVAGYSGRDESVMKALEDGLHGGKGYPAGLFWISRGEPSDVVINFIKKAQGFGIRAGIIRVDTFDELMTEIIKQEALLPEDIFDFLKPEIPAKKAFIATDTEGSYPILRLNALLVSEWPKACRILKCDFNGGNKQVREHLAEKGSNVIAIRRKTGIVGFGQDIDFQTAFAEFSSEGIFDYPIETSRLSWDSPELGLLQTAVCKAFEREKGLTAIHHKGSHTLIPKSEDSRQFASLKKHMPITGVVPRTTNATWYEAIRVKLEYRLGRLWLLMEPTIWCEWPKDQPKPDAVRDFCKFRVEKRFNRNWSTTLDAWIDFLVGQEKTGQVKALGLSAGRDATFTFLRKSAYSLRKPS